MQNQIRHLVLVLGDQLDMESAALADFDSAQDRVLMIEAASEARHVWSHKARIAMFLTAMRHFAAWLTAQKFPVDYVRLDAEAGSLIDILRQRLLKHRPQKLILVEPGEYRLEQAIKDTCKVCRCSAGDSRRHTLSCVSRRVHGMGARLQTIAHGIFLPQHAAQNRCAHGG